MIPLEPDGPEIVCEPVDSDRDPDEIDVFWEFLLAHEDEEENETVA